MKTMKKLVQQVRQLEKQVDVCSKCGICQASCPVYRVTGNEADVARGKLSLIDGLIHEKFANPEGVSKRLERCLLCGSCASECPRGVDVLSIFIKARGLIQEYTGLPFYKKLLFRQVLGAPHRFDHLADWAARCQHLVSKSVPGVSPDAPLVTPLLIGRRVPPLAPVPFRKMVRPRSSHEGSGITAALFVGCLIDKVFPEVGTAIIDILDHHGIHVVVPENQGCCGIPALGAGDRSGFEQLVTHHLECYDTGGIDYIITGCATCTAAIRTLWPMMYSIPSDDSQFRLNRMVDKTIDIADFIFRVTGISERIEKVGAKPRIPVTYHDPCHLKRTLGISEAPRHLIRANPDFSLIEMTQPDVCCGMGGSFGIEYEALSRAIGEKKRADILATQAQIVATGCPACMIQLRDLCTLQDTPIAIRHTAQIYANALKAGRP